MSETLLLYTAVFVFTLMAVGLALTIVEFSRGAPKRQSIESQRNSRTEPVRQPEAG